jgi:hypothetical protein
MMPSVSKKQRNFMAAVAHNPAFAKKTGVSQSVGKDFNEADKGRKFSKGGDIMAGNKKLSVGKSIKDYEDIMDDVAQVEQGIYTDPKTGKQMSKVRGLGPSMAAQRLEKDSAKGRFAAPGQGDVGQFFKKGGMAHKDVKMDKSMMQKAVNKHEGRLHKGQPMTKLAKGGYTRAADGCATKGKTKGTMITMNKGGYAC